MAEGQVSWFPFLVQTKTRRLLVLKRKFLQEQQPFCI